MGHVFNPGTREAEAEGSLEHSRPDWSTVPGQQGLSHRETLSQKINKQRGTGGGHGHPYL